MFGTSTTPIDPELLKGLRQATQTNRVFGADYFQKHAAGNFTQLASKSYLF
jgi:hypothetical protein